MNQTPPDLATVLDAVEDDTTALAALRESQARVRREEMLQIALAARFASFHEVDDHRQAASCADEVPGGEGELLLGGDGSPWISEFCISEFSAATGRSTQAARTFLGTALALVHRLPRTWAAVRAGQVDGWRARRIAEATLAISREAAAWVDGQVAGRAQRVGVRALDNLVEEAIARFDPEQLLDDETDDLDTRHVDLHPGGVGGRAPTSHLDADLDTDDALILDARLDEIADQLDPTLPKAVRRALALGLLARGLVAFTNQHDDQHDGPAAAATGPAATVGPATLNITVRVTEGDTLATIHTLTGQRLGMVSINQLQTWASRSTVVVKPVLDLNLEAVSTGRFARGLLREQVIELNRKCVFPFCGRPAEACDEDHIDEWSDPGPPDQTRTSNLACLCRHHHRLKTFTAWHYRQTQPGVHEWTSPHGLTYRVDPTGTVDLGGELGRSPA